MPRSFLQKVVSILADNHDLRELVFVYSISIRLSYSGGSLFL